MQPLRIVSAVLLSYLLCACSLPRQLHQSARQLVLQDSALQTAHVGISIYEPATGKWWYNWQGDKYFVPASNTKLATCYAAMKYLGDSLVAARFAVANDGVMEVFPSGDPTFLNTEFRFQPLYERLKKEKILRWDVTGWKDQRWGSGWSWNDYEADYMVERSPFPVYANLTKAFVNGNSLDLLPKQKIVWFDSYGVVAGLPADPAVISSRKFQVTRAIDENLFFVKRSTDTFRARLFPMRMDEQFVSMLLKDTLHANNVSTLFIPADYIYRQAKAVVHSQPTDSLLKPMMHRSDNFFAEQTLLMVSNEKLGFMNDEKIIDTLLKTDFKDLPQKPRWVDGSGLSRYNLFTPQDFVAILGKMRNEFGMARLKEILPTGNEGTLKGYYRTDSTAIFAKTGTLSGVVALSGFLATNSGKELIFSVLVNNHQGSATAVRRAVERFVQRLKTRY